MRDELKAVGASLTLIGNGSPEVGAAFVASDDVPFRLLLDPALDGYQAMQLKRRLLTSFRPRTLLRLRQAWREGFRQGPSSGDTTQLGGTFAIVPGGDVVYSYVSRSVDDRPSGEDVVAALRELQG